MTVCMFTTALFNITDKLFNHQESDNSAQHPQSNTHIMRVVVMGVSMRIMGMGMRVGMRMSMVILSSMAVGRNGVRYQMQKGVTKQATRRKTEQYFEQVLVFVCTVQRYEKENENGRNADESCCSQSFQPHHPVWAIVTAGLLCPSLKLLDAFLGLAWLGMRVTVRVDMPVSMIVRMSVFMCMPVVMIVFVAMIVSVAMVMCVSVSVVVCVSMVVRMAVCCVCRIIRLSAVLERGRLVMRVAVVVMVIVSVAMTVQNTRQKADSDYTQ